MTCSGCGQECGERMVRFFGIALCSDCVKRTVRASGSAVGTAVRTAVEEKHPSLLNSTAVKAAMSGVQAFRERMSNK